MNLEQAYSQGGEAAVVRELLRRDNPDDQTFRDRWNAIFTTLQREHPDHPKSGFVE